MTTIADELKEAKREARAQRARADHAVEYAKSERAKRKTLQRNIKEIERAAFIRGSATTVAHHMASWSDDALMLAFTEQVRASINGRNANRGAVEKIVTDICRRHNVEIRDSRELIEMVYAPQLGIPK